MTIKPRSSTRDPNKADTVRELPQYAGKDAKRIFVYVAGFDQYIQTLTTEIERVRLAARDFFEEQSLLDFEISGIDLDNQPFVSDLLKKALVYFMSTYRKIPLQVWQEYEAEYAALPKDSGGYNDQTMQIRLPAALVGDCVGFSNWAQYNLSHAGIGMIWRNAPWYRKILAIALLHTAKAIEGDKKRAAEATPEELG